MTASALLVYFLSFFGVDIEVDVTVDVAPDAEYSASRDEGTSSGDIRDRAYDETHRRISNGF